MRFKDLEKYPLLHFAAVDAFEKRHFETPAGDDRIITFAWGLSPQGHKFWSAVDDGDFKAAKKICPELFEEQKPDEAFSPPWAENEYMMTCDKIGITEPHRSPPSQQPAKEVERAFVSIMDRFESGHYLDGLFK